MTGQINIGLHICRAILIAGILISVIPPSRAVAGRIDASNIPDGMLVHTDPSPNKPSTPPAPYPDFSVNFVAHDLVMTSDEHFDLVLPITASGGVAEYDFLLGLVNLSATDFRGMKVALGFLTGSAFQESALPGLDFDVPDRNSLFDLHFVNLLPAHHGETQIVWPDLPEDLRLTKDGSLFFIDFAVDIPDPLAGNDPLSGEPYIPLGAQILNGSSELTGYALTIRFGPVAVPEPSTAVAMMVMVGGACLRRSGRRGHRSSICKPGKSGRPDGFCMDHRQLYRSCAAISK